MNRPRSWGKRKEAGRGKRSGRVGAGEGKNGDFLHNRAPFKQLEKKKQKLCKKPWTSLNTGVKVMFSFCTTYTDINLITLWCFLGAGKQ